MKFTSLLFVLSCVFMTYVNAGDDLGEKECGTNVSLPVNYINYNIRTLDLHDNLSAKQCIDTDPALFWEKITMFKKLSRLNLSKILNGKLSGTISSFLELTSLDLSYNKLRTLPASIGELSAQCKINLEGNYDLQQRGDNETVWGIEELAAHFDSNVRFS